MTGSDVGVLIFAGLLFTVGFAIFAWIVMRITVNSVQGWITAETAMEKIIEKQTIRITTLENRLMSHNWEEFANLQHVPAESEKDTFAQLNRVPESWGLTREERVTSEGNREGFDLEGVDLEGPTIG